MTHMGRKKLPFNRKKTSEQRQALGGAAICLDQLGVRGGRQDEKHSVEESDR